MEIGVNEWEERRRGGKDTLVQKCMFDSECNGERKRLIKQSRLIRQ